MEGFKGRGTKKRTLGLGILNSPSSYAILCNLHALYETQGRIIHRIIFLSRACYVTEPPMHCVNYDLKVECSIFVKKDTMLYHPPQALM